MKKIRLNKLLIKLLFTIMINGIFASVVFFVAAYLAGHYYLQNLSPVDPTWMNRVYLLTLFASLLTFIIGFGLMIRHKLKQITNLSKEINQIASGSLGKQIIVSGNDEITSLGEDVNRMSLQLKEMFDKERAHEQERHQLISNLSHDLRTPLTSVRGYIQLLIDRPGEINQNYLHIIDRKTRQIETLLEQLSEIDRLIEGGEVLKIGPVNLSRLTRQLFHEYRRLFERDGVQLRLKAELDLEVEADLEKFVRVLQNLLSNALKYAPESTIVTIDVHKDQDGCTLWEISNQTNEETLLQIDKLFQRTYRVDSSRGETFGQGLGLSISRQIMRLHGGDLFVSQSDKDTITFQASFPRASGKVE